MKIRFNFLTVATSFIVGSIALSPIPVRAEIFTRSFSVQIQGGIWGDGIYSGQEFQGYFSYDDKQIYQFWGNTGFALTDFSFNFPGFSEFLPDSFPQNGFENVFTFAVPVWDETRQSLALFYAPGPIGNGENNAFSLFDDRFMYGETIWLGNSMRVNGSGSVTYSPVINTSVPEPGSTAALFSFLGFGVLGLAKKNMS